MGKQNMGQFAVRGIGYLLEGDPADAADRLYVERVCGAASAAPVCTITRRNPDHSWELREVTEPMSDELRDDLVTAAIQQYRVWLVDHD